LVGVNVVVAVNVGVRDGVLLGVNVFVLVGVGVVTAPQSGYMK